MATILQQKPVVVRGGRIEWYPIAASQTWYKGQFVYLDAYGRLTVCSSNATVTVGMAACDNASDDVNTKYPVVVSDEDTLFEMNVIHSTPASATTTISLVGKSWNYTSATYGAYVNRYLQTVPFFHMEALSPKDATGDLFGRAWVQVLPEVSQVGNVID